MIEKLEIYKEKEDEQDQMVSRDCNGLGLIYGMLPFEKIGERK